MEKSYLLQAEGGKLLQEDGGGLLLEQSTVEIKIVNNQFVDANRETYITPIFETLEGLTFYPFEAETTGFGYFEIGDRVVVQDPAGNPFEVVILSINMKFDGGFREVIKAAIPPQTESNYALGGVLGRRITKTEINVDKQNGRIDLINQTLQEDYLTSEQTTAQISLANESIISSVETVTSQVNNAVLQGEQNADAITTIQSDITQIEQTSDQINLKVERTGGVNLFKNSTGLKGNVVEWQEYLDNILIDSRNNATIDQSTEVSQNSESGSALVINDQFIEQTFNSIVGNVYTFYCRYKSVGETRLNITGVDSVVIMPESAEWAVFKYQFTATDVTTTVRIENLSDCTAYLSDLVTKIGEVSGWVQAPNEVYGSNFSFDKDGFRVRSLTSSFESLLDNEKLQVKDTASNKVVMLVSKDSGKITKLIVQEELTIQRYENSEASTRVIPTETGSMIVIND